MNCFCFNPILCPLLSPGIRAAFVVPTAAKDWSPQPLLIEMGRSTVKVCVGLPECV